MTTTLASNLNYISHRETIPKGLLAQKNSNRSYNQKQNAEH